MSVDAAVIWNPNGFVPDTEITCGDVSYSSPPTMAEINAGGTKSGLNQIIAVILRRANLMGIFVGVDYATAGSDEVENTPNHVYSINTVQFWINKIRTDVGIAAYSFTTITSGFTVITAALFTELQQALTFTSVIASTVIQKTYRRDSATLNSIPTAENILSVALHDGGGKMYVPSGGMYIIRDRRLVSVSIPAITIAPLSAIMTLQVNQTDNRLEGFAPVVYSSNTDDSAYSSVSVAYNADNLEGTFSPGTTISSVNVSTSNILAMAGGYISYLLGEDVEMQGNSGNAMLAGGLDPILTGQNAYFAAFLLGGVSMQIDWGF